MAAAESSCVSWVSPALSVDRCASGAVDAVRRVCASSWGDMMSSIVLGIWLPMPIRALKVCGASEAGRVEWVLL
ncbi:hypothetical protein MTP06_40180 [Streptomyces sp. PLM4]|nr:hypothetical protein MTP06_40180 [Streptomyces sp. PLM4]